MKVVIDFMRHLLFCDVPLTRVNNKVRINRNLGRQISIIVTNEGYRYSVYLTLSNPESLHFSFTSHMNTTPDVDIYLLKSYKEFPEEVQIIFERSIYRYIDKHFGFKPKRVKSNA